jgi:hypothetical protein
VTTRRPGWQNAFGDQPERRISVQSAIEGGGGSVGLVQVVLLLLATVVGLPCFFFTLLALLDHFERRLTIGAPVPPAAARPAQVVQVVPAEVMSIEHVFDTDTDAGSERIGADVVELPSPFAPSSAPAAATG